jgi:hypothetical protein
MIVLELSVLDSRADKRLRFQVAGLLLRAELRNPPDVAQVALRLNEFFADEGHFLGLTRQGDPNEHRRQGELGLASLVCYHL